MRVQQSKFDAPRSRVMEKNKQSTKKPTLNMMNTHSRNKWDKIFMNNIRVKKNENK